MSQPQQQIEYCEETGETFCGKFAHIKPKKLIRFTPTKDIVLNEYKIALKKFDLKTEVINNKMKKEIQENELKILRSGNKSQGFSSICIRERYEKNAYQRKRNFQKKWGEGGSN